MLPPFSTGNPIGSGVFPDSVDTGLKVDRNVTNIWSTGTGVAAEPRSQQLAGPNERHPTWGSYQAAQHSAATSIPEYQPSWSYQGTHHGHLQDVRAGWGGSEHDQGWKYGRSQGPPPPPNGGVWNYPSAGGVEYHDWNSRQTQAVSQQAGYYYVSSGHDQRQEEYIPYDIGARRSHHQYQSSPHMMPPPPPGYPLPPHMQYYGQPAPVPQVSPDIQSGPPYPQSSSPTLPYQRGAASFLFEAAAAAGKSEQLEVAKVDSAVVDPPKKSLPEKSNSIIDAATSSPIREPVLRGESSFKKGPHPGRDRVNNHQARLHSTGNEKAPLSASQQAASVTTLMIRNIPNRYSQSELLMEIREAGFDTKFDFFYLPMDHETHANFGYAFINFVDEREVAPFTKRFNGLKLNRFTSNKIIQIVPAQLQGFQANLQHYCKKAVCTDDNIDYRPLFFVDGKCLEFHRASDFADAVKAKSGSANESGPVPDFSMATKEDERSSRSEFRGNSAQKNKSDGGKGNKVFHRRGRQEG